MFYTADTNRHGLKHDPFKAIVSPRPIGWIGSKGRDGSINLSPYSYFNILAEKPKIVMFSSGGRKHSMRNAEETRVFTVSFVTANLAVPMNASSADVPYGVNEFLLAGLSATLGTMVDAPFVGEAFAALECRVTDIIQPKDLDGNPSEAFMVMGQVVGVHLSDEILRDGRVDMQRAVPLGRLGYKDYSAADDIFEMERPFLPR